jgi:hypothetical protein
MSDSFYLNTMDLTTISICIAALISAPFLTGRKLSMTFTDNITTIPSVRHRITNTWQAFATVGGENVRGGRAEVFDCVAGDYRY